MNINKNILMKKIFPVVAGAVLGYAYYYFVGCSTGSCPISSNPYISTVYGAIFGAVLSFSSKKKTVVSDADNKTN